MKIEQAARHLESWMVGKHVWLSDEFSVPAETLCLQRAPSPNADHFCQRPVAHQGKCQFHYSPDLRAQSWKALRNDRH